MNQQYLFIICVFALVVVPAFLLIRMLLSNEGSKLRERLRANSPTTNVEKKPASASVGSMFKSIGQAVAAPFEPKTRERQADLRKKLAKAGIYSGQGVRLMNGCKVIFLSLGLIGGYVIGLTLGNMILGLSVGGLVGYLAPGMWLKMRIKKHQRALDHGLSDAIDLLVVCVEAGLTIDSSMQRVGEEINIAHPSLARELEITHMETRVGLARSEALKNLGQRTGSGALQALASMLIQAERFGTSVANALRVHAESMRQARQHQAEEVAAKATVKLSFPVVLFIFPAVLIVLAGPACLGLFKSALFNN